MEGLIRWDWLVDNNSYRDGKCVADGGVDAWERSLEDRPRFLTQPYGPLTSNNPCLHSHANFIPLPLHLRGISQGWADRKLFFELE